GAAGSFAACSADDGPVSDASGCSWLMLALPPLITTEVARGRHRPAQATQVSPLHSGAPTKGTSTAIRGSASTVGGDACRRLLRPHFELAALDVAAVVEVGEAQVQVERARLHPIFGSVHEGAGGEDAGQRRADVDIVGALRTAGGRHLHLALM